MRGPLAVAIDDGNGAQHVTRFVRDLRFKRSAFGGDVDLSCTLNVPRGMFTNLGAGSELYLYDGRTGGTAWSGTIDNPGAVSGPAGESYNLHAFGGATRLQAVRKALAPVHAADDGWRRSGNSTKGARTGEEERTDGTPTWETSWNKGYEVEVFDMGEWVFRGFQQAGLKTGRVSCDIDAGLNSADYVQRIMSGTDASSLSVGVSDTASTTPDSMFATILSGGITAGDDVVALRAMRAAGSGSLVIPNKTHWFRFYNVIVRQLLVDRYGDDRIVAYLTWTTATDVIEDMVGRGMCPGLDPDKVSIASTSYMIDALSWLDGITFGDALAELLVFEPDLWWAVYGDAATFATWDHDNPRYVISKRDGGISLPGQEITLCNRVLVSWTDRRGREQTTVVEDAVDGLDYTRDAEPISLPDGLGSAANAQRAGEQALARNNDPPRAGTAVVRRPIRDLHAGCDVLPHELLPGYVVVEQETGDQFRLTDVDYADQDGAAALTLGEPVRTEAQELARMARKQRRRGR